MYFLGIGFPCGWTYVYVETPSLFGNCFSCLKTTIGITGGAKKKKNKKIKKNRKSCIENRNRKHIKGNGLEIIIEWNPAHKNVGESFAIYCAWMILCRIYPTEIQ